MKEYHISDCRGTTAVILPEKGATVVSFCRDGVEYLYCDRENLRSTERPRCGIPFLFPIFGRLKDGCYRWDGREYAMGIHGFGHLSAWQVTQAEEDSLTLVLEENDGTLEQYPFRFRVTLEFRVEEGALTICQRYENRDSGPMPYSYGFHPYFLADTPEELSITTCADTYLDFTSGPRAFGNGSVSLSLPEGAQEAGAAFLGVKGPTVLRREGAPGSLKMEFDSSFHTHVLWTQAGKPFVCVEPVNGTADGLNTGNYLLLQPGEKKDAFLRLTARRREYYEAYDDRFRQVHNRQLQWFDNAASPIVREVMERYHIGKLHSVLEIGCGEGRDAGALLEAGYSVIATDVSAAAIDFCRKKWPRFRDAFRVLDCLREDPEEKVDFLYGVAVLHMLVRQEDRAGFYGFFAGNLKPGGIGLICTMGDGIRERATDPAQAFALQERIHEQSGTTVKIAGTTCRVVNRDTFRRELEENGLRILEEGMTEVPPDFPQMLYAVVAKKT